MFSDNKFKARIAACIRSIIFCVTSSHSSDPLISYFLSPVIYDTTICCFGYVLAIVIRLKLSMICLLTRLSQYTDVVLWLICVVDHTYLIHPLSKQLLV